MESESDSAADGRGSHRIFVWGLLVAVLALAVAVSACSGEERVTVPDLVGMEEAEARGVVTGLGLELGGIERVPLDAATGEPDTVLSQLPAAGTEVDSGSQVSLVVAEELQEAGDEDEAETPPATSSGSGADSGPAAGAGAGTDAGTGANEAWHTVDAASGKEGNSDYQGALFTLSAATPPELTVAVSSSPAGGEVRFTLFDRKKGAAIHHSTDLDVTIVGSTTSATQVFEPMTLPAGDYQMNVIRVALPAMTMTWSYTLREWR